MAFRYAHLIEGRLEHDRLPLLGDKPVRSLLPRTMLEALRMIEARDSDEMSHRARNQSSEIFRVGLPDGRCKSDPCRDLSAAIIKPAPVCHRAKIETKDLPEFYARLNADSGSKMSQLALRWTIRIMVRPQETRFAQWTEFEGPGRDEPLWCQAADIAMVPASPGRSCRMAP